MCKWVIILMVGLFGCEAYYDIEIPVNTDTEIIEWINRNIENMQDIYSHGVRDYWQTPLETIALQTGDCEDKAILFMYFVKKYCDIDSKFECIKVVKGVYIKDHVRVIYDNKIYDPYTENEWTYLKTIFIIGYNEVMNIAKHIK